MPLPPASIHLHLFGRVAWATGGEPVPVVAGRPTEIAAILALEQPGWVSIDRLLELLWDRPPASRANAVQRHVSRLRHQLADLGVADPCAVVEWSPAGYRLARPVTTDLDSLDDGASTDGAVSWWHPPLGGVDLDRLVEVRTTLTVRAERHRRRWLDHHAERAPDDTLAFLLEHVGAWHGDPSMTRRAVLLAERIDDDGLRRLAAEPLAESARCAALHDVVARARMLTARPTPFDFGLLTPVEEAVLADDVDAAFARHLLEPSSARRARGARRPRRSVRRPRAGCLRGSGTRAVAG